MHGIFKDGTDEPYGIVRLVKSDGLIFEGMSQNEVPNGFGRLLMVDGSYYVGMFVDGVK